MSSRLRPASSGITLPCTLPVIHRTRPPNRPQTLSSSSENICAFFYFLTQNIYTLCSYSITLKCLQYYYFNNKSYFVESFLIQAKSPSGSSSSSLSLSLSLNSWLPSLKPMVDTDFSLQTSQWYFKYIHHSLTLQFFLIHSQTISLSSPSHTNSSYKQPVRRRLY